MNVEKSLFYINLRESVCVGATLSHTCIFSAVRVRIFPPLSPHVYSPSDDWVDIHYFQLYFFFLFAFCHLVRWQALDRHTWSWVQTPHRHTDSGNKCEVNGTNCMSTNDENLFYGHRLFIFSVHSFICLFGRWHEFRTRQHATAAPEKKNNMDKIFMVHHFEAVSSSGPK